MATIAGLEAKIRSLKEKKKKLQKRKGEVQKVQSKMNSSIPGYISDANKRIKACEKDIADAISVPGNETWATEDVREKIQKSMGEDQYMGEVVSCIEKEIQRCEDEIDELEREITRLEKQLKALKEEKAKELLGGIFG